MLAAVNLKHQIAMMTVRQTILKTSSGSHALVRFQVDDTLSVVPIRRIIDGSIKDELCDVEWDDSEILRAIIVAIGTYAEMRKCGKGSYQGDGK